MDSISLREHEKQEVNFSNIEVETLRTYFSNQLDIWPTQETGRYLVKAQSYAGVIVLPTGRTVFINPKVPIQTLFALIARVYDHNKEIFKDQPQPYTTVSELFEFIVSYFIGHTEDLIARGLLRGYQSLIEDSLVIRGRLLIAETIHHNTGLQYKHWCSYRHFTIDIPENRVLLWTTFLLRAWDYVDVSLLGRLHRIQHILSDVFLDSTARTLVDSIEFHRLNDPYKPALTLARLILDYLSISGSQGNEPFLAYLIDMDVLFQQYLGAILQQETENNGYWIKEEETHSLDLGKKITIRPDILIYQGERPCLVVDAKYKLSASGVDLYQMLAYCHAVGINQAVLVHPENETSPFGTITMRGPGNICVNYLSINLNGGPQQLEEQGNQLVTEILQIIHQQDLEITLVDSLQSLAK